MTSSHIRYFIESPFLMHSLEKKRKQNISAVDCAKKYIIIQFDRMYRLQKKIIIKYLGLWKEEKNKNK